jgi:hypothetical protein
MRLELFLISWGIVAGMVVFYLSWGIASDIASVYVARRRERVLDVLSVVLFESDDEAEAVHGQVMELPRRPLLVVLQSLALDLDGGAQARLQQLVRTAGIERFIRRRAGSSRWRMRVQAAQLHYLVTHPDFDRSALLADKRPIVRARAVETLTTAQISVHIDEVMTMLNDEFGAVRLAAQQTLLRAGPVAVPRLIGHLEGNPANVLRALEVAANLPDPRLVQVLDGHARSRDPIVRAMAAKALGNGSGSTAIDTLHGLLDDPEPNVRAMAIESLARLESVASVSLIGRALADRAFHVRRAAGLALDELGAAGRLVLRRHLDDPDRFGRDMARQVLDASAAQSGLTTIPPLEDPLAGLDEDDIYGTLVPAVGPVSDMAGGRAEAAPVEAISPWDEARRRAETSRFAPLGMSSNETPDSEGVRS